MLDAGRRQRILALLALLGSCARTSDPAPSDETPAEKDASPPDAAAGISPPDVRRDTRPPDRGAMIPEVGPFDFPVCKQPGAFYCDDFESGKLDPRLPVYGLVNGNSLVVDSTRPAHGSKHSLHVVVSKAAGNYVDLVLMKPMPAGTRHFFMRSMIYLKGPGAVQNYYWFFPSGKLPKTSEAGGIAVGSINVPWADPTGMRHTQLGYQPGDRGSMTDHLVPFDRWACWELELNDDLNEMRVWVDDAQHAEVTRSSQPGGWTMPIIDTVQYGLGHSHDEKDDPEAWFDDVVIAPTRIGCSP